MAAGGPDVGGIEYLEADGRAPSILWCDREFKS